MNVKIAPRKGTDRGGYIMMPMKKNLPEVTREDWTLTKCPFCGQECYDRELPDGFTADMFQGKCCTECAVKLSLNNR